MQDISTTDAAEITKLDIGMVHHESWNPIYFGGEKVTSHKSIAGVSLCILVIAGFF